MSTTPMTKIREEWREEVKKWPEMDALGSADWWLYRFQGELEKLEGEIEKERKNTNYPDEKIYNEARRQEYGFNCALSRVLELIRQHKEK